MMQQSVVYRRNCKSVHVESNDIALELERLGPQFINIFAVQDPQSAFTLVPLQMTNNTVLVQVAGEGQQGNIHATALSRQPGGLGSNAG